MPRVGLWVLLAVVLCTAACGRRDQQAGGTSQAPPARPAHPTLGAAVDVSRDSLLLAMRPRLNAWLNRWSHVVPGFTFDSLYRLPPEPFRPVFSRKLTAEDQRRARRFGEVSPDSTKIAEADSYRAIIDGAPELWPEPDSAPALAVTADSLRILVTVGTTGGFEDALWIDSSGYVEAAWADLKARFSVPAL